MIIEDFPEEFNDRMLYPVTFIVDYKDGEPIKQRKGFKASVINGILSGKMPIPERFNGTIEYPKGNILVHLDSAMNTIDLYAIVTDLAFHGYWNEWTSNIKGSNLYGLVKIWEISVPNFHGHVEALLTSEGKIIKLECEDLAWSYFNVMYNPTSNVYYDKSTGKILKNIDKNNYAITFLRNLEELGCDSRELYYNSLLL